MIDRRMLVNIDWILLILVFSIGTWGLVTVYSATHGRLETHLDDLYLRQIYWFCAGLVLMILVTLVDYQYLSRGAYLLLALGILSPHRRVPLWPGGIRCTSLVSPRAFLLPTFRDREGLSRVEFCTVLHRNTS